MLTIIFTLGIAFCSGTLNSPLLPQSGTSSQGQTSTSGNQTSTTNNQNVNKTSGSNGGTDTLKQTPRTSNPGSPQPGSPGGTSGDQTSTNSNQNTGQPSGSNGGVDTPSQAPSSNNQDVTNENNPDPSGGVDTLTGVISEDGKVFIDDRDKKSWSITNASKVKGYKGEHVTVKGRIDAQKNEILVLKTPHSDNAFRKKR